MNRVLYQLSYAAIWSRDFGTTEISSIIIPNVQKFVKGYLLIFRGIFGDTLPEVISVEKIKKLALFGIGGSAYVGLELLWRGRSHISMFGAGGVCFLLLGDLKDAPLPAALRLGAGAGIITAVELATGLAVNRDYRVWDYRSLPGNYRGQICPQFAVLWLPVSALAMAMYSAAEDGLDKLLKKAPR